METSLKGASGDLLLEITGRLDSQATDKLYRQLDKILTHGQALTLDLTGVDYLDSAGVAALVESRFLADKRGARLSLRGLNGSLKETLAMFHVQEQQEVAQRRVGFLEGMGEGVLRSLGGVSDLGRLIGQAVRGVVVDPFTGAPIRWTAVIEQCVRIGSEALPIVGLISFLIGLTIALMSALQLKQFGANIFVANLIGVAMTRELGPLMAAILVAGRSGSSIAAEISTMMVTEEVDALKTMGIRPIGFLVVPKVIAITITQPLLTILADILGILGGFLVGTLYLEISPTAFMNQLLDSLMLKDILTGLIKSVAFAWLIVIVGCYKGFQVSGGAEGVGKVTTSSVVTGIFLIILADCFFSVLFYFFL